MVTDHRRSRRQSNSRATDQAYQQGHLDALCGIYSPINALAALLATRHSLLARRAKKLFHHAVAHVGVRIPFEQAAAIGIEPRLWFGLTQELAAQIQPMLGEAVIVKRPFADATRYGFPQVRRAIERALDRGSVVLVSLVGAYNHYTVIHAHTAGHFLLHDSDDLHKLLKTACGSHRSSKRHRINPRWVVVLEMAETARRGVPP